MMVVTPFVTPVITPVVDPIVAIAVLLLTHVPPAEASATVTEEPAQTVVIPVIADGNGLTVNEVDAIQPVAPIV